MAVRYRWLQAPATTFICSANALALPLRGALPSWHSVRIPASSPYRSILSSPFTGLRTTLSTSERISSNAWSRFPSAVKASPRAPSPNRRAASALRDRSHHIQVITAEARSRPIARGKPLFGPLTRHPRCSSGAAPAGPNPAIPSSRAAGHTRQSPAHRPAAAECCRRAVPTCSR